MVRWYIKASYFSGGANAMTAIAPSASTSIQPIVRPMRSLARQRSRTSAQSASQARSGLRSSTKPARIMTAHSQMESPAVEPITSTVKAISPKPSAACSAIRSSAGRSSSGIIVRPKPPARPVSASVTRIRQAAASKASIKAGVTGLLVR